MEAAEEERARGVALGIARDLGLDVDEATVLHSSNKLALRLRPADVFARVGTAGQGQARFEVDLARRFAAVDAPVARLDPRVAPRHHERDGLEVTFWTYHAAVAPAVDPAAVAAALARFHERARAVDLPTPRFTDRVDQAERVVTHPDLSPALADADRDLLNGTLRRIRRAVVDRGAPEQLLHGEPHPGNVLATAEGAVLIDLETACRGPVAFDLAHVPEPVAARYPEVDPGLLADCRHLVLAMVAAWRWERGDQLPNGAAFGHELLRVLRAGPPWPTLDQVAPTEAGGETPPEGRRFRRT